MIESEGEDETLSDLAHSSESPDKNTPHPTYDALLERVTHAETALEQMREQIETLLTSISEYETQKHEHLPVQIEHTPSPPHFSLSDGQLLQSRLEQDESQFHQLQSDFLALQKRSDVEKEKLDALNSSLADFSVRLTQVEDSQKAMVKEERTISSTEQTILSTPPTESLVPFAPKDDPTIRLDSMAQQISKLQSQKTQMLTALLSVQSMFSAINERLRISEEKLLHFPPPSDN